MNCPEPLVQFHDVSKRFSAGAPAAVEHVSLQLPPGQFCVLLGASGAGKSTLLRMVNGLVTPSEGAVSVDGVEVTPRSLRRIQARIGMVHQQFHLVPRLSVLDNVLMGALPALSTPHALLHLFPERLRRKACSLLAQVGLTEAHLYRRANSLSGGQQQRIAIARAFILDPVLVLADEPVASLDPLTSRNILTLLKTASLQRGASVLCSLHQVDLAREYADRIVALRSGRVVFDGLPTDLSPQLERAIYAEAPPPALDPSPLLATGDLGVLAR